MDTFYPTDYCVPITTPQQGESAIYRRSFTKDGLISNKFEGIDTMQKWLLKSFQQNGARNSLGTFNFEKDAYEYISYQVTLPILYKTLQEQATQLGSALLTKQLVSAITDSQGITIKPVGLYSKNRAEWTIVDVACQLYGLATTTFYETLGPSSISYGIKLTQCRQFNNLYYFLRICFCQASTAQHLASSPDTSTLQTIVLFDKIDEETSKIFEEKGISILQFSELLQIGKNSVLPYPDDVNKQTPLSLSFTSGTTGDPKAVVQTHGNYAAMCSINSINLTEDDVHLSYLPLPHVFERTLVLRSLVSGTTICFYTGNMLNLKDDFQRAKPTFLGSVPRIYNRFYDSIRQLFNAASEEQRAFINKALEIKLDNYHKTGQVTHKEFDETVFAKTKALFGGRQRFMVTGAAPIAVETLDFLKVVLCCPILEAYGQTECTGGGFLTNMNDGQSGHVGGCSTMLEVKLEDIPDMEYLSTDKHANGELTPRGEVCFRGPGVMAGYFGQPEITRETIDKDGWLHTGDVGIMLPNGTLKIIDRKKNLFKLSQAEYVSPEKVENIYIRVVGVLECFVYGDSLKNCCVGIVVPDSTIITRHASTLGVEGSFEELCSNTKIRQHLLKLLNEHGTAEKLYGFEQIKNVHLETKSFAQVGVLTDTQKMQRFVARKHYLDIIQELYKEIGE